MGADKFQAWLDANRDGLLIGVIVAAVLVAIMLVLRELGRRAVARDRDGWGWHTVIGRVLSRTSLAFMVLAAADVVASYADLPHKPERLLDVAFVIAFAIQGAIWGRELILGMIGHKVARENGSGTLGNAMAIIRVLVSVALFAIAFILILDNLGVNVTALVAGLGIGGIAIGLAAQGIFADLFAALSILFDKPFKKGDTIRYDNSTGTVERIGLKTTRLRSITGEQLIMANTKLLEREIHNMALAKARRVTLYLAVGGEISESTIGAVADAASETVGSLKGCKFIRCALSGAGSSALTFDFVYDDSSRDTDVLASNRSAILGKLIGALAARKLNLVRASDQQTAPLLF
ncbi:MAG TPA: mechanosensitive ion channel domain-containing protein [Sphingomicrobium sp.]|jgi:small-conductance mechanosensitive channel|nr:mechanosensitive ion channel domain-containing protein [Sphingomicrobium sp.]